MQLTKQMILQGSNKGFDFYALALGELKMVNEYRCENILNPCYGDDNPALSIYTSEEADRWYHKDYGEETYTGDVFDWAALHYDLDIQKDFKLILSNMAADLNIGSGNNKNHNETEFDNKTSFEYGNIPDEPWVKSFGFRLDYHSKDYGMKKLLNYFAKYGITEEVLKSYNVTAIDKYHRVDWFKKKIVSNSLQNLDLVVAYNDTYFTKLYSPNPKKFWFIGRRDPQHVFGIKELFRKLHKTKTSISTLIITGGEKDVLTLASLGYDAISLNSETAKMPHTLTDNWLHAAARIVILYDIDETGKRRAEEIFNELRKDFLNVSVCTLPDTLIAKDGKDVSDYMSAGLPVNELHSLIKSCETNIAKEVTNTPAKSNNINEKIINDPSLSTPCFSQSIYDQLPNFLKEVCSHFDTPRDKDLVLLSTLGVTSSFFPKVKGIYDGAKIGSNLYLFISAPPAAGKGVMKWGRKLGDTIQSSLQEKYNKDLKNYLIELAEYNQNKSDNPDAEKPEEPKQTTMFIPANSSVSKMIQLMGANGDFGVIFENEGDTLSNALKSDWGNFSDVLRKAFHHEPVSLARRGNNEFIEINKPHLSVTLSGTPNQINNLIESVENGFFSRFLFYDFKSPIKWLNQFGKGNNSIELAFTELAAYMNDLWEIQTNATETIVLLEDRHIEIINNFFRERIELLPLDHGEEIVASVKRFCLSLYRIAIILAIFRTLENNRWLPEKINISENDVQLSLSIIDTLFTHLVKVYTRLQTAVHLGKLNTQQRKLFDVLPSEFSTKEFEEKREQIGIKTAAGKKYLSDYIQKSVLERIAQGQYKKAV